MANIWEEAISILAGNLNSGRGYLSYHSYTRKLSLYILIPNIYLEFEFEFDFGPQRIRNLDLGSTLMHRTVQQYFLRSIVNYQCTFFLSDPKLKTTVCRVGGIEEKIFSVNCPKLISYILWLLQGISWSHLFFWPEFILD